jgi:hypothetical protein
MAKTHNYRACHDGHSTTNTKSQSTGSSVELTNFDALHDYCLTRRLSRSGVSSTSVLAMATTALRLLLDTAMLNSLLEQRYDNVRNLFRLGEWNLGRGRVLVNAAWLLLHSIWRVVGMCD